MENNDATKLDLIERQVGTLKFVVLIMAIALIYGSFHKTGLLGEYKIVAISIAVEKVIFRHNKDNLGTIALSDDNKIKITLTQENKQIEITPEKIQFLKINDINEEVLLSVKPWLKLCI